MAKTVRLHQFSGGHFQLKEIPVVHEHPLSVYVNGQELVTLLCTPTKLEALVVGFLAFEGVIHSLDDVQSLTILDGGEYADVRLTSEFVPPRRRIHTSGCGGGITFSLETHMSAALEDDSAIDPRSLFPLIRELYIEAHSYRESRGIHAAALAEGEKLLIVTEDVGRHNAIDKIAGYMYRHGVSPEGKLFYTTGRLTSEMVIKTVQMRIPILISRSGFTAWGVDLARRAGLTLIGRAKGKRFIALSGAERLVFDADPREITEEGRRFQRKSSLAEDAA
jgi:FdhD protein